MSLQTHQMAARWLSDGVSAVVVIVLEARGSAPRDAGTRMIVSSTQAVGTIGGGHLELKAIQHARTLLRGVNLPPMVHYPLGPALGQCCGGAVTLGFTRLNSQAMSVWPRPEPVFHLQLYGAGHVGRAIARILATLDVQVDWIDEREEEFPFSLFENAPWPDHIRTVCVDAIEDEVRYAVPGGYYLVLTHNHDLDMRITEAILQRGDFAYLGLIGSMTKRQRFIHRFEQRGIAPERLARMTCPIGIEGINGKQPEIIAVAVVAQLLQAQGIPALNEEVRPAEGSGARSPEPSRTVVQSELERALQRTQETAGAVVEGIDQRLLNARAPEHEPTREVAASPATELLQEPAPELTSEPARAAALDPAPESAIEPFR